MPLRAQIPSTNPVRAEFFLFLPPRVVTTATTHSVPATPPLQISPFPGTTVNPGGSVSFSATGGDGNYTFSIVANPSGATLTPPTPRGMKRTVIDDLSKHEVESERISKALKQIRKALSDEFWIDGAHLDSKRGKKIFDHDRHAVKELMHLLKKPNGVSPAALAAAETAIDGLVPTDRFLAATLLNEASSAAVVDHKRQKKVDKALAKAQKELDKGDAERGAGKFEKAIYHYGKTWKQASKAAKETAKQKGKKK